MEFFLWFLIMFNVLNDHTIMATSTGSVENKLEVCTCVSRKIHFPKICNL